jgi:hypothetical protein
MAQEACKAGSADGKPLGAGKTNPMQTDSAVHGVTPSALRCVSTRLSARIVQFD